MLQILNFDHPGESINALTSTNKRAPEDTGALYCTLVETHTKCKHHVKLRLLLIIPQEETMEMPADNVDRDSLLTMWALVITVARWDICIRIVI